MTRTATDNSQREHDQQGRSSSAHTNETLDRRDEFRDAPRFPDVALFGE
jgi:hypothetical protein